MFASAAAEKISEHLRKQGCRRRSALNTFCTFAVAKNIQFWVAIDDLQRNVNMAVLSL